MILVLNRPLINLLFPEHCRTSCSDKHACNGYPNEAYGPPDCKRCFALHHIDEPLSSFVIHTTIHEKPPPPKPAFEITVERRADDYMAYLNGDKRLWDCGKTPDEAIGKLMRTHPDAMKAKVTVK